MREKRTFSFECYLSYQKNYRIFTKRPGIKVKKRCVKNKVEDIQGCMDKTHRFSVQKRQVFIFTERASAVFMGVSHEF